MTENLGLLLMEYNINTLLLLYKAGEIALTKKEKKWLNIKD